VRNARSDSGVIGKIFKTEHDFKIEQKTQKLLKAIDPNYDFIVPFYGSCKADLAKATPSDNLEQCRTALSGPLGATSTPSQLLFKFGGIDIGALADMHQPMDDLVYPLFALFKGLKTMNTHGREYLHCDITPGNVVFDKATNRMYLIDFGWFMKKTDVSKELDLMLHDYPYYPPEMKVFSVMYYHPREYSEMRLEYYTQLITRNFSAHMSEDVISTYMSVTGVDYRDALETFIKRSIRLTESAYVKLYKSRYINMYDSYSLAMTFLECCHLCNQPMNENTRQFLVSVILPAIHPDPELRIGLDEILSRYESHLAKYPRKAAGTRRTH